MDIETRLAAIEEKQNRILDLLAGKETSTGNTMTLKEAAQYAGYSPDHFRRLAVERRLIPFTRPSGQAKGKILFRKIDLDRFLGGNDKEQTGPGRRRKPATRMIW